MKKYKKHLIRGAFLTAMVTGLSGCSEFWCWPFDCSSDETSVGIDDSSNTPTATVTDTTQDETAPAPATAGATTDFDLNKVVWLHTDVSGWPETKSMTVELGGGVICLNGSFSTEWPGAEISHTSGAYNISVNANPWVFAFRNGQWYGGTWEWFTVGNTCKPARTVSGDHVKRPPMAIDWDPVKGETLYFMVSTIARGANLNNIQERTNVVKVVWPEDWD